MHRLILGCIFLFAYCTVVGQTPMADSLKAQLATEMDDSSRIMTLTQLVMEVRYLDNLEAMDYAEEAYELAKNTGFRLGQGIAARLLGGLFHEIAADEQALSYCLESLELLEKEGVKLELARTHLTIGLLYSDVENFERAVEYFDNSEKLYAEDGRVKGVRVVRHNKAIIFHEQGKQEKALELYRNNLADPQFIKDKRSFSATLNNVGNVYYDLGLLDSAAHYFLWSIELKRAIPDLGARANSYSNLAKVFTAQGALKKARIYLDTATALAQKGHVLDRLMEVYEISARLNEKEGRYQQANADLQKVLAYRDTIYDPVRTEQMTQLSAFYVSNRQREEIELLSHQQADEAANNQTFRWLIMGLLVVLVLVAGLFVSALMRSRERTRSNNELLRKNEEIERQKREIVAQNKVLSQQNESLEELNREKDGLIGIVAHDIRAPLNRSAALAELIASVGPLNEDQQQFLDMIRKVSDDGARLIQDLLELNAYERADARVDFEEKNISDLVTASVHGHRPCANAKDIEIILDLPDCALIAFTDDRLLTRVLDNLLSNAIKFTYPDKRIFVRLRSQNSQLYLSVRDEGQGISEADQAKMFRKFQRLTARPTGGEPSTGLGLSIIKTLVERLQGRIRVQSEVGFGTEFRISIPLVPDGAKRSLASPVAKAGGTSHQPHS